MHLHLRLLYSCVYHWVRSRSHTTLSIHLVIHVTCAYIIYTTQLKAAHSTVVRAHGWFRPAPPFEQNPRNSSGIRMYMRKYVCIYVVTSTHVISHLHTCNCVHDHTYINYVPSELYKKITSEDTTNTCTSQHITYMYVYVIVQV